MTDSSSEANPDGSIDVPARLVLFGFDPVDGTARVRLRSRQWRVRGAVQIMAVFLVVAPIVALLPPHAPWPIGALAVGTILARRRLSEDCTLVSLDAACPKCGAAVRTKPTRLREPHAIACEGCHHQAKLKIDPEVLGRG